MIVVDSSVLISAFRGDETSAALRFRDLIDLDDVLIGDIVLLEVLRGARDEKHATALERKLRAFHIEPMLSVEIAVKAATNYRRLRTLGVTIRKAPDLIIGTFCVEFDHSLLHSDRDFDPMVEHLGLRTI